MPYITQDDRVPLKSVLDQLPVLKNKGELEYCIYYLMTQFMNSGSRTERYSHLHDAVYAAAHCADEFRRRRLDVREDLAIAANGDIR